MRHATGSRVWSTDVWSVKVIVPPGFTPPASVAMSWIVWPAVAVAVALVVSVGVAFFTAPASPASPQPVLPAGLFCSPPQLAVLRWRPPRRAATARPGEEPLPAPVAL